jgi:1,4-dihydroxy-6-naphthoate synthase
VSVHAYAFLTDRYMLCTCGASMGDQYGPIVVAKKKIPIEALQTAVIAVPGELTTAFLALQLVIGKKYSYVVVPFDRILDAVVAGEYEGKKIDAGLVIHEGQLTFGDQQLELIVDTGVWWYEQTGLPLPLGANGIRKDLGPAVIRDVQRLLKESIAYGLSHREEALDYALSYGRGLDPRKADRFVAMYVNDWTLDFGPRGRQAVAELLARGHQAGAIPNLVIPEFAP